MTIPEGIARRATEVAGGVGGDKGEQFRAECAVLAV